MNNAATPKRYISAVSEEMRDIEKMFEDLARAYSLGMPADEALEDALEARYLELARQG